MVGINGWYISFQVSTSSQVRSANLPTNTWYHFAGIYDGADLILYINGELVATEPQDGSPSLAATDLIFAQPENGWLGMLDDISIWDRVLSAAEIADIYANGLAGIGS